MAGFGKSAVIEALKGKHAEAVADADANHAKELKVWENDRAEIQKAKKNLRQAVRDLVDEKIEIEAFAKRIKSSGEGVYRSLGWVDRAMRKVPVPPVRKPSHKEVALLSAIRLVESASGDSLSVTELRQLGILDYVRG